MLGKSHKLLIISSENPASIGFFAPSTVYPHLDNIYMLFLCSSSKCFFAISLPTTFQEVFLHSFKVVAKLALYCCRSGVLQDIISLESFPFLKGKEQVLAVLFIVDNCNKLKRYN
jgi:hypothetical protein